MLLTGLIITACAGAAILVIGVLYVTRPQPMAASFGLPVPTAPDAVPWLRLKGWRDLATGLVAGTLLLTASPPVIAAVVLAFIVIPLGDCVTVLRAGGKKAAAWGIHAATAALMLIGVLALWLA